MNNKEIKHLIKRFKSLPKETKVEVSMENVKGLTSEDTKTITIDEYIDILKGFAALAKNKGRG